MLRRIVLDRFYPHPPERVWRALTDSEALAEWLMPNDFQPRVGHRFQFRGKPQPGWRGIVDCEVREVDPPRRLSYTWRGHEGQTEPTLVTFILTPEGAGTRLRFEHTGFEGLRGLVDRFAMGLGVGRIYGRLLPAVLARLAAAEATAPPHTPGSRL